MTSKGNREAVERRRIFEKQKPTKRTFKFGESEYEGLKSLEIPCKIGEHEFYIETVVIDGDVPWLIGRKTMERMERDIKLGKGEICIGDMGREEIEFKVDNRGHMRITLGRRMWMEEVRLGEDKGLNRKELRKLHLQFGHPGWERLFKTIEESKEGEGDWNSKEI